MEAGSKAVRQALQWYLDNDPSLIAHATIGIAVQCIESLAAELVEAHPGRSEARLVEAWKRIETLEDELRVAKENAAFVSGPFTPEEDALLGTMTDREAAKKMGRDYHVVCYRRRRLGKAKFPT